MRKIIHIEIGNITINFTGGSLIDIISLILCVVGLVLTVIALV